MNDESAHFGDDLALRIVLLIPRRHIETWIRCLLSESVNEEQDRKLGPKLEREDLNRACGELYNWSRPYAALGSTCVDSLQIALPEWRKIG